MKKYTIILLFLAILLPKISLADTALSVTNITANRPSAIANGLYIDGWKWTFNVTVPVGEDRLQMKFADWTNGSSTIPTGSNMRLYSTQSLNASTSDSAITLNSANTYGDEIILDPTKGQQVQVAVEIKVPAGTTGGSYSTSYGIKTTGTTTPTVDVPALTLRLSTNSQATSTLVYGSGETKYHVFGIKTKDNTVAWVNDLSFKVNIKEGYVPRSLINGIWIGLPGKATSYNDKGEWIDDNTVVFHNLNTRLSQSSGDFTLMVSPAATTTIFTASVVLDGSGIGAEDNSGNALDVSNVESVTSNEITYAPLITSIETRLSTDTPATSTVLIGNQIPILTFGIKPSADNTLDGPSRYNIKNISFVIHSKDGQDITTLLSEAQLFSNGNMELLGSSTVGMGGVISFANISHNISLDWEDLILKVSTKSGAGAFTISATLDDNSIQGEDGNKISLDVSKAIDVTGNEITFSPRPAAVLEISTSPSNPRSTNIIANSGSNSNEADTVTALVFNLRAQNDNVKISNLSASTTLSAGDIATAYLYDGSTILASASVSGGTATFSDLDLAITKDTTKALTLKVDIRNASSSPGNLNASILASGITAEDSTGATTAVNGSTISNTLTVQKAGPTFSLMGMGLTKTAIGNTASSSFTAEFYINTAAQGGDVHVSSTDSFVVGVYIDGVKVTTANVGCSAGSGATASGNSFIIADGNTARLSTGYSFVTPSEVYTPAGASVSVRLESITTNFGTMTFSDEFRIGSQIL